MKGSKNQVHKRVKNLLRSCLRLNFFGKSLEGPMG